MKFAKKMVIIVLFINSCTCKLVYSKLEGNIVLDVK